MSITASRATEHVSSGRLVPETLSAPVPCGCAILDATRRNLALATAAALLERERRERLEHALHEEVGQELAGIAFALGAVRRSPQARAGSCDTQLQVIADLLGAVIARCARMACVP
jgi:signal transduction histidine kinase